MSDEKELTAAAEAQEQETPVEAIQAPAEVEETPAEVQEVPAVTEEVSAEAEEVPAEAEEVPAEAEEAPAEAEEVPAEAEEVPAKAEEAPAEAEKNTETAPEKQEEKPAEAEKTEAKEVKEETPAKEAKTAKDGLLTALGVLFCLILAPILIANVTMIVKSYTNADEVPSFGGYCPFIVMTDSMVPTVNSGDLVIDKVVTDPAEVKVGDIISFFDPASKSQSIVTHRVVEVTKDVDGIAFRTKGDGNNSADDDVVPGKNVVGIYVGKISGMGHVVMFMQSTPGLIVCVALPILLLIGYDALRRRKYDKQQQTDTEALLKELEALRKQQGK